jgi:hypothetical protein
MRDLYFILLVICLLPQIVLAADIVGGVAGTLTVKNSIIYNDLKFKQIGSNVSISNSAVRGSTPPNGGGNLLFSNTGFKDVVVPTNTLSYYLSPLSSLVNKGINIGYLSTKDINGNDRTYDGNVDIGAVEYSMISKNPNSNWTTASDWRIGRVPTVNDIVTIRTATQVATTNAVCKKILAIESGASLTVNAGSQLIVSETINNTDVNRLIVRASSSEPNGSLIFQNTSANPVSATVEMFSKSNYDLTRPANDRYNWQFFGIPVEAIPANPTFYGAYVRIRMENGTDNTKHWVSLTNSSQVTPFLGYQICYATPRKVWFSGKLVNRDYNSGQLPKTTGALYPGQHLLANPYTAAIDIKKIEFGNDMDKTVYLYNTGTFSQWEANTSKQGGNPGQYFGIPQANAGVGGIPGQVPSMSSMLVKVNNSASNAYVKINYNAAIKQNTEQQRVKREGAETSEHLYTRIDLESKSFSDRLWVFADEKLSRNFDNGYDGYKLYISPNIPQIYAIEQDGNYQINSVDDLNNTTIAFQPGEDTDYQLIFNNHNLDKRYSKLLLFDLAKEKVMDVTANGSVYNFTADPKLDSVARFKLITEKIQTPDVDPSKVGFYTDNNNLHIYNYGNTGNVMIYDISGRLLFQRHLYPNGITTIALQKQTVYIVKTTIPNETRSTKIIID